MTITGTVKNGEIIPDEPLSWPNGTRVSVWLADESEEWDDFDVSDLPESSAKHGLPPVPESLQCDRPHIVDE